MFDEKKEEIRDRVKKNMALWMVARGMNKTTLAAKMGVSKPFISQLFHGDKITMLQINKIAAALDIDPARLLDK